MSYKQTKTELQILDRKDHVSEILRQHHVGILSNWKLSALKVKKDYGIAKMIGPFYKSFPQNDNCIILFE